MAEETSRAAAVPTWSDAMRRLREMAAQMTSAAQAMAVAGAKATPRALSQPLARYADQLLAVGATITTPLRQLLDEQERLVEMMADWAEQHRHLSEQIADWAEQQRSVSERMLELARPFLDQAAMLESLEAEWSRRSTDREPQSAPATTAPAKAPARKTAATKTAARKAPARKSAAPRAAQRPR